ncbi:KilA-N domain-containing protein [Alysiella crassa]|uniref:KilA-N domain n=1 Tax=Alysiella crassa TaxID=153491 RepID=A0A376BWA4_9NEIS|nr:KilA-N domain-containing protein [Alysiella crassa]UOP06545.1 KilA-N domain-containing protein [Alysiella crassa]SSY81078.1 KilA-N domain [Alysiella crassa]
MNAIQISNVSIRQEDNLFNLNDLHKASGGSKKHQPAFWLRNQQTKELIAEIENSANFQSLAIQKIEGRNGGTFACKELVIHYAMWISPKFSLQVIQTFLNTVSGSPAIEQPTQAPQIPDYDYGMARLFVKHGAGVAQVSDLHMALYQLSHIQGTFLKMLEHKALHFKLNDAEQRCLEILASWQVAVAKVGANIGK